MEYSPEMATDCPLATEIYSSLSFHIVQWCIFTACFSSVLVVIYSYICFHFKHPFENSTKELITVLYFYVTVYSSSQVFNQGILLYYRYSASSACEAQVPRGFCIGRMLGSSIVPSFVVIHLAITVQRALSTFSVGSTIQLIVSRVLIVTSFIYAIVYGLLTYLPEPLDGYSAYCSSITKSSEAAVVLNIVVMFALDVVNVVFSFCLWRYNKYKLKCRSSYRLEDTYRHRQNAQTTFNFLPIEVIHAVVYCSLFVIYVLGGNLKRQYSDGEYLFINVVTNIFPYYVLACPLILTILIRKDRINRRKDVKGMIKQGAHTKEYFEALAKQWNTEETPKWTMRKSV